MIKCNYLFYKTSKRFVSLVKSQKEFGSPYYGVNRPENFF